MTTTLAALVLVAGAAPVWVITVEASRRQVPVRDAWQWRERWTWTLAAVASWSLWLEMFVRLRAEVRP